MERCLIGFGSNQGDSQFLLDQTIERLTLHQGLSNLACAKPVRTAAVLGGDLGTHESNSAQYLNTVFGVDSDLSARALFELLVEIESSLGRIRQERWGARTVDLDLLLYGDQVIQSPDLIVPHPRMSFRKFVLVGAAEVGGDLVHPVIGATIDELWQQVQTTSRRVLWLAEDKDIAQATIDRLHQARQAKQDLGAHDWTIDLRGLEAWNDAAHDVDRGLLLSNPANRAADYALLVVSGPMEPFCKAARWFSGPSLMLDEVSDFDRELLAALEAIG